MANNLRTYSGLKQQIIDTLKRPDLTDEIDSFIQLAEAMLIPPKFTIRELKVRATALCNEEYETLPPRFQAPISITEMVGYTVQNPGEENETVVWDGKRRKIKMATFGQMDEKYPTNTGQETKEYSLLANEIWFRPFVKNFYYEIRYYERPEPILTAPGGVNKILDAYPGVYLYGSLMQAAPYIGNDARIATWQNLYTGLIDSLNEKDSQYESMNMSMPAVGSYNP